MDPIAEKLLLVLAGLAVGIVGTWIKLRLISTARLRWAIGHPFSFVIDEAAETAGYTRTLLLANAGRVPAERVEIVLAHRPQFFQVHPPISFSETPSPDSFIITFPHIGPRQTITVEMLAVGPFQQHLPDITVVRSKAGPAPVVPLIAQKITPVWIRLTSIVLQITGAALILAAVTDRVVRFLQSSGWLPTPLW